MRSTLKQCEAQEAFKRLGAVGSGDTPCREVGIVFVRDDTGYGHWVCPQHRRVFALDLPKEAER